MPRLQCPRCQATVEVPPGTKPTCPECGFGTKATGAARPPSSGTPAARPQRGAAPPPQRGPAASPRGAPSAARPAHPPGRPAPRRSRTGLIVTLVVVGLLVVAGGVVGAGFALGWFDAGPDTTFPDSFYVAEADAPASMRLADADGLIAGALGMTENPGEIDAEALSESDPAPLEAFGALYTDEDDTVFMLSVAFSFASKDDAIAWLQDDGGCPAGYSAAFVKGAEVAVLSVGEEGGDGLPVFEDARATLAAQTGKDDWCADLLLEGSDDAAVLEEGMSGPFDLRRGDVAWHTFTLETRTTVFLAAMSDSDTELSLYDEDGDLVAYNDDFGTGYDSAIEERLDAGTYLVRVNEIERLATEYEMWLDLDGDAPPGI